jgi:hypothetical protein
MQKKALKPFYQQIELEYPPEIQIALFWVALFVLGMKIISYNSRLQGIRLDSDIILLPDFL